MSAAVLCQPRIAASSSIKAVSFPSACTTKRFPSPRCASAIQIVRPQGSTVTQINELQLTGQATTVMRMRFLIIFALTAAFTFSVWVTPAAADGKITEGTFQTGDVIYRDPLTHAAENIGDKPMHFILVELKSEAASGTSARPLQREAICRNLGLPLPVQ